MFPPFEDYCAFIANLPEQFPCIRSSTLQVYTIGPLTAEVEGRITFGSGYLLDVWELLDLSTNTLRRYSYELYQGEEKVWWYDPQSHPDDVTLAATDPHHKHIQPDIKHHRVPAPELSFTSPNIPFLIQEVRQRLT